MYKIFIFVIGIAILFISCESIPKSYELTGYILNSQFNGKTIYLSKVDGDELTNIDSTLVKENKFMFKGVQDAPVVCYLRFRKENTLSQYTPVTFILENGKITVKMSPSYSEATGTALNDSLLSFRRIVKQYQDKLSGIDLQYKQGIVDSSMTADKEKQMYNEYNYIEKTKLKYIRKIIGQNLNNVLGAYIFCMNQNTLSDEELGNILQKSGSVFRNKPDVKLISERLKRLDDISIGKIFKDFRSYNIQGKECYLSEYAGRGKFLIVTFWSSVCPSSRVNIKDLMNVYQEYRYKGVDIIGVSLDEDSLSWVNAIKHMDLACTNLSDLRGWKSEAAKIYEINRIPYILLLNPDGSIAAKETNSGMLKQKLQELLK
ncbi:DUF4369 domain-containing protein [Coprobacter sp.]